MIFVRAEHTLLSIPSGQVSNELLPPSFLSSSLFSFSEFAADIVVRQTERELHGNDVWNGEHLIRPQARVAM
jgi:hypothetical protein